MVHHDPITSYKANSRRGSGSLSLILTLDTSSLTCDPEQLAAKQASIDDILINNGLDNGKSHSSDSAFTGLGDSHALSLSTRSSATNARVISLSMKRLRLELCDVLGEVLREARCPLCCCSFACSGGGSKPFVSPTPRVQSCKAILISS